MSMTIPQQKSQHMSGGEIVEEYNKDLCTERHQKIDKQLEQLFARLNWFYLLIIATLATSIANLVMK